MDMKDLIEQLRIVATRWERENPIIGVGNLRYCDALRDAADAIEKQESRKKRSSDIQGQMELQGI